MDTHSSRLFRVVLSTLFLAASSARAQAPVAPKPTRADVPYGPHPKQVLDVYQASTDHATPLLFFVHGGGWMTGDKANPDFLAQCLANGISVVSINYRFIPDAPVEKGVPPVKTCLDDAARALQFVRSHASEWHIDKTRIGGCGGSAGGFTALWLAFHPDRADPGSADPVARESTRLCCALCFVPQTTLDPQQLQAWIPNNTYGAHAFGLASMQEFLDKRAALLPWIQEFSPDALVTPDDPPVLLFYDNPPHLGQPYKDPPHSGNFGAGIEGKLKAAGIEYEINYNNDYTHMKYPNLFDFLKAKLAPRPTP